MIRTEEQRQGAGGRTLLRHPPSHEASEDRGYEGQVCENCRFSKAVWGLKEARLVCENKAGAGSGESRTFEQWNSRENSGGLRNGREVTKVQRCKGVKRLRLGATTLPSTPCGRSGQAGQAIRLAMLAHGKQGKARRMCIVVDEEGSCGNFEYSRDVVAPENARALAEGARLIPLTQDKFAIVDAEDYEWLCKCKWYAQRVGKNYYARNRRKEGLVSMHRVIMNAPKGLVVDHINHNTLDNRRKNLRLCTWAQNNQNRRPSKRKNKLSKYKGVSFDKKRKVFRVLIWHNKKQYFLGTFKDEKEAAKAYDRKACELFGEFAYLNFPQEN